MTRLLRASFGAFLLMLGAVLVAFLITSTDADLYFRIQKAEGVEAGVSDEVMREYDGRMADYLRGDDRALSDAPLFGDREIAHMRDVQRIFLALRNAAYVIIAASAILIAECVVRNYDWKRMLLRASALGSGMLVLLLLIPVVWALIDFESAFLVMHKVLFTNDLWLLDPDTDLMIRMLPERFFVHLSGVLALRCVLAALIVPFISFCVARIPPGFFRKARGIFSKETGGRP